MRKIRTTPTREHDKVEAAVAQEDAAEAVLVVEDEVVGGGL